MKWTSLNDLREKYLAFFESKDHLRLPSYPLIPHNDKSLLLINSGMAPMKKFFTGEEEPPRRRVTTCQNGDECVRINLPDGVLKSFNLILTEADAKDPDVIAGICALAIP